MHDHRIGQLHVKSQHLQLKREILKAASREHLGDFQAVAVHQLLLKLQSNLNSLLGLK